MNLDIDEINKIAKKAGNAIMKIYKENALQITLKKDRSPITAADIASHKIIVDHLTHQYPEIPCVSEEGSTPPYEDRKRWKHFWLIDPLDGTKNFINGNGDFTVNIALIEGRVPILGVIYVPDKEILCFAYKKGGAWKQEGKNEPKRIQVKERIDKEGVIVVENRAYSSVRVNLLLKRWKIKQRIPMRSFQKFCAVADGEADISVHPGPVWEWDTAAGQCIIEEAGGRVVDMHWKPVWYNKPLLKNQGFIALSRAVKQCNLEKNPNGEIRQPIGH
jgi:3'(2'), 5'-bisphosphate nucleotidase